MIVRHMRHQLRRRYSSVAALVEHNDGFSSNKEPPSRRRLIRETGRYERVKMGIGGGFRRQLDRETGFVHLVPIHVPADSSFGGVVSDNRARNERKQVPETEAIAVDSHMEEPDEDRRKKQSAKSYKKRDRGGAEEEEESAKKPVRRQKKAPKPPVPKRTVQLPQSMTIRELGMLSGVGVKALMSRLVQTGGVEEGKLKESPISKYIMAQLRIEAEGGKMRAINRQVSAVAESLSIGIDVAQLLLLEFDIESEELIEKVQDEKSLAVPNVGTARPPIVTVMGHVDHGKTTLMDALRHTSVTADEEGGITQKVGAFTVTLNDQTAVFLDTPGHAAFSSMRRCGAVVTDIIVLVVAATDGVRPQTIESIELARGCSVPIVVALTKVDVDGINEEEARQRVASELNTYGLATEEVGGDVQMVSVAAQTGFGLDSLVDALFLQSEMMELKADAKARGEAIVIESSVDPFLGSVADVIVRWGTLKKGDIIVVGEQQTKVRQLLDSVTGKELRKVTPSLPARVIGLSGPVTPGSEMLVVKNVKRAKEVCSLRERRRLAAEAVEVTEQLKEEASEPSEEENDDDAEKPEEPVFSTILLKADTDGSLEALRYSVEALGHELGEKLPEGSGFKILREAVGEISQADIDLAASFDAKIFGFNVRAPRKVMSLATSEGVDIITKGVIYHLVEDIGESLLSNKPVAEQLEIMGKAEVQQTFVMNAEKRGESEWVVAGCKVVEGTASVKHRVRVVRNGEIIHSSSGLDSLRHYKDRVKSVKSGQECGIALTGFQDFQPNDVIEFYVLS